MILDRDRVAEALPGYEIRGELGRGGWGIVLEGRHVQLGRDVAIKQLPRAFAADPAVRGRFLAEARVLAALDHPHIVPVYDFVEHDGLCLLVMEKMTGGTLWERFTSSGITMDRALAAVLATCAALQCAHLRNVLHRDIKPENVMFTTSGVLKVTDFGIAKVLGGPETLATRAGEVLGTPAYMAPEQAQAKELSPATDVYAVGVMIYELLSGRLPFEDDGDALALLYRHVYEEPAPLAQSAPTVPAGVSDVVMRSLATSPEARYPSAEQFGVALAEAATAAWGPGWLARGDLPVLAAGPIVAVTERQSGPLVPPVPATDAPRRAPATEADHAIDALPANAPVSHSSAPSRPSAPSRSMRPAVTVHTKAAVPDDAARMDMVPVHDVVERPDPPRPQLVGVAALLLVALAIAFVGLGSPARTGDLAIVVNGAAPVPGHPVKLDLSAPVVISGRVPAGSVGKVSVRFSVVGLELGSARADAQALPDGSFSASLDASSARYLVTGTTTAVVEALDPNGSPVTGDPKTSRRSFGVRPTQSPLLTVPGAAGVALLLFVVAYAESLLRALRRGRKRIAGMAGMVVIGALCGVAAVVVAWLVAKREPMVLTLVVCSLLGAGAGRCAALAAWRVHERRRFRVRST